MLSATDEKIASVGSFLMRFDRKERRAYEKKGMTNALVAGPLLAELVDAQVAAERELAYPNVRVWAQQVVQLCERLGGPLVWPVDAPAERLAGAAEVVGGGRLRVRGWTHGCEGERVLLLSVTAVTPAGILAAAEHARRLGAREVYACGVHIGGTENPAVKEALDSYSELKFPSDLLRSTRQTVAA
jgi:hypothetical protein